jgi:hypothetical protein
MTQSSFQEALRKSFLLAKIHYEKAFGCWQFTIISDFKMFGAAFSKYKSGLKPKGQS